MLSSNTLGTISICLWIKSIPSTSGCSFWVIGSIDKNGSFVYSTTNPNCASNGTLYYLGRDSRTGDTAFKGKLNDFRFYDHCLSAKEVKEISQGLVLHYKLDGFSGGVGENLLRGSASIGNTNALIPGWISNGSASNIEIIDNKIIHYKYNLNNTKYIPSIVSNVVAPLQWGKTYTYSMDLKLDKDITLGTSVPMHYWIGSRTADDIWQTNINNHSIAGSTTTSWVQNHTGTLLANTWITIITKFTLPASAVESGYDYPGLRAFIYGSVLTTAYTGEVNVWMKNCKIELGDIATAWSPAPQDLGIDITKITDSSGYGNNGTITGNLTVENNSDRYGISSYFNGSSYISTAAGTFNWFDFNQCTISAWLKPTASMTGWRGSVGVQQDGGQTIKGFSLTDYGNELRAVTVNGSYTTVASGKTLPVGEWHHCVITLNGTELKQYYDGALAKTSTVDWGTATAPTAARFAVGVDFPGTDEKFTGNYSDIRFYATALSAEDILDLYHISANIDNLGGIHGFEFEEKQGNIFSNVNIAITGASDKNANGVGTYTQANCAVTYENNAIRIYRPSNITHNSSSMHNMWGGMRLRNSSVNSCHEYNENTDNIFGLQKNHTYVIYFTVKGQSSNAATSVGWTNQMGWGGGGLTPNPTNIEYLYTSVNFNGEMQCFYKFTISDDVVKTCTTAYSYATVGKQYLSYNDFMYGFGYENTGSLGTDVYVNNFRMFDITSLDNKNITLNGIVNFLSFNEENDDIAHIHKFGEMQVMNIIEK